MKFQTIFERKILSLSNNTHFQYVELFDSLDIKESTKRDYLYRVPHFLQFVKNNGFSSNTYLEYKRHLECINSMSIATKNKHLITAKVFLRELTRRGYIPDITTNVKLFSDSRKHKRAGITDKEIVAISNHIRTLQNNLDNVRLKSIIALLVYQGLRICEIAQIELRDVDLIAQTLDIKGKGHDHKDAVFLNPKTVEAVRSHIKQHGLSDGWLYPCLSNNGRGKHISTRTIQNIVGDMLTKLQIEKSCHSFRHYFVTTLIAEYKSDLTQVMNYSRHKTLSMLIVYNDAIQQKKDLPRFYDTFKEVNLA